MTVCNDNSNAAITAAPHIRSFVRREGRLTRGQQRALDEEWARFGIDPAVTALDPQHCFGRAAPLVLDIGFGDGEALATMAQAAPEVDFLGVEVHRPGVGHLLLRAAALDLHNLRIWCVDAVELIGQRLPANCLDRVQIFFPDPWPKARHHKRRLLQPAFVATLLRVLRPGGIVHVATDCSDYAGFALAVLQNTAGLRNTVTTGDFAARPVERPLTKFEQRGLRLGHVIHDLLFVRDA